MSSRGHFEIVEGGNALKHKFIVGVMGGGKADDRKMQLAYELGKQIAQKGWVLLNGGRDAGIMAASARGASENGGITIGILPDEHTGHASEYVQIPICTGMGSARNTINVLSSDIVVACPGGAGTISEIALALKHGKRVITLAFDIGSLFEKTGYAGAILAAETPNEVIELIENLKKRM